MTKVTFDVFIINDNIHEGNESYTLNIVTISLPNRVQCRNPCMAAVTIVDTSGESLIMRYEV